MKYTLSDEVIAAIGKSLQLAMLTGTDITDHMRLLELSEDPNVKGLLLLSDDGKKRMDDNVEAFLTKASELAYEQAAAREDV